MRPQRILLARSCLAVLVGLLAVTLLASCKRDESTTAAAESAAALADGPKLVLDSTSHDFGEILEGEALKHSIKITNGGNAPLIIDRVKTTCGCTVAKLENKEVPPGESTEVEVTFNSRNRRGQQTKEITFESNDASSPHKFKIIADVISVLAFEPRHVQLATSHGTEVTREAWLEGKMANEAKLEITNVEGDEEDGKKVVSVELAERQEGGETKRGLRFKVEGKQVGTGRGMVAVNTGVEKVPILKLGFNWTVSGNLQGIPRNLYFGVHGAPERTRVIRVRSKLKDFKLVSARIVEGPFKAEIETPDAGADKQVRVSVTQPESAASPGRQITGKLEIVTNDPLEPKKTVDLRLRPRRGPPGGPPGRGGRPGPRPPRPRGPRPTPPPSQ